jgi:hypothetical protein
MSVAQAMAFAPNFSKGLVSAGKIFQLLARVPTVKDKQGAIEGPLVCLIVFCLYFPSNCYSVNPKAVYSLLPFFFVNFLFPRSK